MNIENRENIEKAVSKYVNNVISKKYPFILGIHWILYDGDWLRLNLLGDYKLLRHELKNKPFYDLKMRGNDAVWLTTKNEFQPLKDISDEVRQFMKLITTKNYIPVNVNIKLK